MEKINGTRVIAGGLLAGAVINVSEFVVNGVLLKARWATAMRDLRKPAQISSLAMESFIVWGFLLGVFAIWLYAAIRPRYGPGPKTAAVAGVALWVLGYLVNSIPVAAMHLFPRHPLAYRAAAGLVAVVAGTVLGAWLYKEADSPGKALG